MDLLAPGNEIVIFLFFLINECILQKQAVPVLIKEMGVVFQVVIEALSLKY